MAGRNENGEDGEEKQRARKVKKKLENGFCSWSLFPLRQCGEGRSNHRLRLRERHRHARRRPRPGQLDEQQVLVGAEGRAGLVEGRGGDPPDAGGAVGVAQREGVGPRVEAAEEDEVPEVAVVVVVVVALVVVVLHVRDLLHQLPPLQGVY